MGLKQTIQGQVWAGFKGEHKNPVYLIDGENEIFIDDIMKSFFNKYVKITIEMVEE